MSRRDLSANAADTDQADDGVDTANWELLREIITAAHEGDAAAHVAALLRLERDVPVDAKAGAYLWYLLRYRVAALLGRRPLPEDLHEIAQRHAPKFAKLIRGGQTELEDTLLSVFGFATRGGKVRGGKAIIVGSAALGVLLNDVEVELAEIRPHLADWWKRNSNKFRNLEP
jgi:hypothetical protein